MIAPFAKAGLLCAAGALLSGCGQAVFTPQCKQPSGSDIARPIDIAALGDGVWAVANSDPDELYCGGFISFHDASGAVVAEPLLLPVSEGYEANFSTLATSATHLWLSGRRYGYLLGVRKSNKSLDVVVPEVFAERVFSAGPDHVIAWTGRNLEPLTMWFDANDGRKLGERVASLNPLRATAYDAARDRLWLAFDGAPSVQYVDLPDFENPVERHPRGVGRSHNIRGMVVVDDIVYGVDYSAAALLSWDADSGAALAAQPIGVFPVALARDDAGRLWLLDGQAAIHVYQDGAWRLANTDLLRPSAFALVDGGALVLDFELQTLALVPTP